MNLLFTIDHGYVSILSKCLRSIRRFAAEGGYDVYLLHPDLEEVDMEHIEEEIAPRTPRSAVWEDMRLYPIRVDASAFDFFPENFRYPKTMYYRIFAADFLPASVSRILYLDPDIVVINPLTELYQMDMKGKYYLGCTHTKKMLTEINRIRLDLPEAAHYINTGVLMMNLEELRAGQSKEEVVRFCEKYGKVFTLPDQDIISALYGAKTGLLDTIRYNLSDRILALYNADPRNQEKIDVDWLRRNGVIIHYCGRNKPWKENYMGVLHVFYDEVE